MLCIRPTCISREGSLGLLLQAPVGCANGGKPLEWQLRIPPLPPRCSVGLCREPRSASPQFSRHLSLSQSSPPCPVCNDPPFPSLTPPLPSTPASEHFSLPCEYICGLINDYEQTCTNFTLQNARSPLLMLWVIPQDLLLTPSPQEQCYNSYYLNYA